MQLDDYSQLAVLSGRRLEGTVTWKSIAEARNVNAQATVRDALVAAEPVSYDRDLREILPELQQTGYVFVRGATNAIDGIVTATDVVGLYGEVEEPFLLLGELDLTLRAVIVATFTSQEINALCNPDQDADTTVDKLSFGLPASAGKRRVLGQARLGAGPRGVHEAARADPRVPQRLHALQPRPGPHGHPHAPRDDQGSAPL